MFNQTTHAANDAALPGTRLREGVAVRRVRVCVRELRHREELVCSSMAERLAMSGDRTCSSSDDDGVMWRRGVCRARPSEIIVRDCR